MIVKRTWLLGLWWGCATLSQAQQPDSAGLLKVHLDMRSSLVEKRLVSMWGTSLGWEWGKMRNEVTIGYYWMGDRGRRQLGRLQEARARALGQEEYLAVDMRYGGVGYWHTVADRKRWKLAVPLELGLGQARMSPVSLQASLPATGTESREIIVPLQVAGYGEWKATRWLGTGLQAGYRWHLTGADSRLPPLNGLYYRIRVLVYMDTFYDWRDHLFRKEALRSPFY